RITKGSPLVGGDERTGSRCYPSLKVPTRGSVAAKWPRSRLRVSVPGVEQMLPKAANAASCFETHCRASKTCSSLQVLDGDAIFLSMKRYPTLYMRLPCSLRPLCPHIGVKIAAVAGARHEPGASDEFAEAFAVMALGGVSGEYRLKRRHD